MMKYSFTKMQALGNDFVVLDGVSEAVRLTAGEVRRLADRRFGVGCDQVLVVEGGVAGEVAEFVMRVFNQDGGEVGQCGNGARCVARFLAEEGLSGSNPVVVRAGGRDLRLEAYGDGSVGVEMGVPVFAAGEVPFLVEGEGEGEDGVYGLELEGGAVSFSVVSMGNPHAVLLCGEGGVAGSVDGAAVAEVGAGVCGHARFPQGANVGFVEVVGREHIRLRVYERGVGETLGCGSGACAAVAVGVKRGWLERGAEVRVSLPGGDAWVRWAGGEASVVLRGEAKTVFCGRIAV